MSTAGPTTAARTAPRHAADADGTFAARLADYRELAKPKIAAMALVTVALGFLAAGGDDPVLLFHAAVGVTLVAAASGTLNQYAERDTDARMLRTADRPLPAGRVSPAEALAFGIACGVAGTYYLWLVVNPATAGLALATLLLYVGVYTPLKRVSWWSTVVGAVPGAMPPLLGWAAAGGGVDPAALGLFAILFLWQFPHFLAIAWLYRVQYAEAGLHMLPGPIPERGWTGRLAVATAAVLVPVGVLPSVYGGAGVVTAAAAVVLGLAYLHFSVRFLADESRTTARRVLFASLGYLPTLLAVMAAEMLIS